MPTSALRPLSFFVLAIAATIALLALSKGDTVKAGFGNPSFQPVLDVHLCKGLPNDFVHPDLRGPNPRTPPDYGGCSPDNAAPGSNPDITTQFLIPTGDHNFAPDYWETSVTYFTVANDDAIADGSLAGGLSAIITVGLTTNACTTTLLPDFIWWEGEADDCLTNQVVTQPEGTPNRWSTVVTNGGDPYAQEADSNSLMVTKYPDFLNKLFDPDGDGLDGGTIGTRPVCPWARYAGASMVPANGDWQMLQNIVFKASDLQAAFSANSTTTKHPFAKLTGGIGGTADLGYVNVVILNDPTASTASVSAISDFCTILGTQGELLGTVGGVARVTAPAGEAVSRFAQVRTQSLRDKDSDGIENPFDTCPYDANIENPYSSNGPDQDCFDSVCDPTPGANSTLPPSNQLGDHDGDYYINCQDLSPAHQNIDPGHGGPGEKENEATLAYNTTAPDGGPSGDAIGDSADADDINSDGDYFNMIYVGSVCVTANPAVKDKDNDGWCVNDGDADPYDGDDPDDNDPTIPGSTYSVRLPSTGDPDLDDNQSGKVYSTADSSQEWAVGTDPKNNCPQVKPHDTWPPDINVDGTANIMDVVLLFPPVFGKSPPDPNYVVRKDLNADGVINIMDVVLLFPPVFGKICTQ